MVYRLGADQCAGWRIGMYVCVFVNGYVKIYRLYACI